jgi:hypothetical protein
MNSVQRAKSFRILQSFVLVTLVLALAGIAIPAQAQTFTDLHDFNPGGGDPSNFVSGDLRKAGMAIFTASRGTVAAQAAAPYLTSLRTEPRRWSSASMVRTVLRNWAA